MGRKSNARWVYILKDAQLSYRESDIKKFIELWNQGEPIAAIAEKIHVKKYDVALLVMHCELEGMIEPRPGGLLGSKKFKWRPKNECVKSF
jgi:hypothetical protein